MHNCSGSRLGLFRRGFINVFFITVGKTPCFREIFTISVLTGIIISEDSLSRKVGKRSSEQVEVFINFKMSHISVVAGLKEDSVFVQVVVTGNVGQEMLESILDWILSILLLKNSLK